MANPVIPVSLASVLDSGQAVLVNAWRLTRKDGTIIRLTSWDQTLQFMGETFEPMDAFDSSARDLPEGLETSNQEVVGYLSSAKITEQDLRLGLYNDAVVDEYLLSAEHPWAGVLYWRKFYIESTEYDNVSFKLQIADLGYKTSSIAGGFYTFECRNGLGDAFGKPPEIAGCRYDVESARITGTVSGTADLVDQLEFETGLGNAAGYFDYGKVTWTSGFNRGSEQDVLAYTQPEGKFRLLEETAYEIRPGDTFTVIPGCDKTFPVCRTKFSQGPNYGGFPFIPGTNQVIRTPDAKE